MRRKLEHLNVIYDCFANYSTVEFNTEWMAPFNFFFVKQILIYFHQIFCVNDNSMQEMLTT